MSASELRLGAAHLLYALTLSATATALFGAWGLPIAGFIALIWWQILSGAQREERTWAEQSSARNPDRSGRFTLELAVLLVICMLLLALFLPAADESDPMRHAEFSMQVVAKAIAAYEQQHGQRLPAVVYDSQGRPVHSWRALILPQLGEDALAAAYRLDEPWDSPSNQRLSEVRPWHFQTYYPQSNIQQSQTSLHLIAMGSRKYVFEHEAMACNWLEPQHLALESWDEINTTPDVQRGFWRRGFFMSKYRGRLAVSDAGTVQIHPDANLAELAASRGSRHSSRWTRLEIGDPVSRYHFDHALQLGCFLFVALYPIRWLRRIQSND